MNLKLAQIAALEAKKNYHGTTDTAMGNLYPMEELFAEADDVCAEELNRDWSGAFAFLCVQQAGIGLPLRYPDTRVHGSFAFVPAWEAYARLPKIGLWRRNLETPEIGDLVVFEPKEGKPAQMGIILSIEAEQMEVAIGNYHNHSAIAEKSLREGIRGYIRLENHK